MSVFLSSGLVLCDHGVGQVDDVTVLVLFDHVKSLASTNHRMHQYAALTRSTAPYSRMHDIGWSNAGLVGNLLDTDLLLGIQ